MSQILPFHFGSMFVENRYHSVSHRINFRVGLREIIITEVFEVPEHQKKITKLVEKFEQTF